LFIKAATEVCNKIRRNGQIFSGGTKLFMSNAEKHAEKFRAADTLTIRENAGNYLPEIVSGMPANEIAGFQTSLRPTGSKENVDSRRKGRMTECLVRDVTL